MTETATTGTKTDTKTETATTGAETVRRPVGALPGDPTPRRRLAAMVRVDHAGEYGARRIYQGQLAVMGKGRLGPVLRHMAEQEQEHLTYFEKQLAERKVRPTLLQPFWHVAGWALGAATALMGERAAMACTVAVEEVIDGHYAEQLAELGPDEAPLAESIARFQAEELEHRDVGLENGAEQAPAYPALSGAIRAGTRAAIWLAERV